MEGIVTYGHKYVKPEKETVLEKIEEKRQLALDRAVSPQRLSYRMLPDGFSGYLVYELLHENEYGGQDLEFSKSAFSQMLNRKKVPVAFYERCTHNLQAMIFNEHVRTGLPVMLRMLKDTPDQEVSEVSMVRAVLSDKYGIKDDHEVFPVVLDVLEDQEIAIRSFTYDDRISQLLIEFADAQAQYNNQNHVAGLLVSNSETGHSSVWCEPVVTIPSCSFVNRGSLRRQGVDCRIVHRGEIEQARIRQMVLQAKEIAQVGVVQLAEAWGQKITAGYALQFAKAIDSLPKRMFDILKDEWEEEEEIIKAEAARRIILMAQELPLFQRIQTEQAAGQMLGLFNNYKARMQAILEEIN